MNLYRITYQWPKRTYDVYLGAVVAAPSEAAAKRIHPSGSFVWDSCGAQWEPKPEVLEKHGFAWVDYLRDRAKDGEDWPPTPRDVKVELLGTAQSDTAPGVILASFRHG